MSDYLVFYAVSVVSQPCNGSHVTVAITVAIRSWYMYGCRHCNADIFVEKLSINARLLMPLMLRHVIKWFVQNN